ncbi:hypothetical protein FHS29_005525 [Saccharothrix tamanrassetensis]|uniref:Uncharacterized protein n=1 Tax=Saccharothrix tamanrassetensis TaxID=1051531 RepID=A0A841CU09_9PSEU|nr:hypothetical protein [Saccharothrix tamanrassetensis]
MHAKGRERALGLPEATFDRDVEQWLVRLWPASASR